MDSTNVLVLWMSKDQTGDARAYRDYILESLRTGVLILPPDVTWEVMELPRLGGMDILPAERVPPVTETAMLQERDTPQPENRYQREAEEKRLIVQRLKAYRAAHGRGCFAAVSRATRTKGTISEELLLGIATDLAPKMELSDWRKIGKALDKLEAKEAADVQNP